jgi:hypothetical protein
MEDQIKDTCKQMEKNAMAIYFLEVNRRSVEEDRAYKKCNNTLKEIDAKQDQVLQVIRDIFALDQVLLKEYYEGQNRD